MSVWHYLESKFYFPLPKIKPVFCKEKKKKEWIHSYKRAVIVSYTHHLLLSLPHTRTQQLVIKL